MHSPNAMCYILSLLEYPIDKGPITYNSMAPHKVCFAQSIIMINT